ncbi:MAG: M23 family metallopeptidase [Chitinophagaceae bacterium]
MKKWFFIFFSPVLGSAQSLPVAHYPQHYFRDPLDIPIVLAGNFGELRPNHFHSGIDIKTQGHINMAVHAAADGYISRVAVSDSGFGHVIYITHPNGYTTVYGHLNHFFPKLEAYVKSHQYEEKTWEIDLEIPPGLFPVKKGEFIAWSGDTGASLAPHVHFEIRNTRTGHPLNPMLFGFKILDHIPPAIYRLALYDRDKSIYEQHPLQFQVRGETGATTLYTRLIHCPFNHVGFGVDAIDHQNGTHNTYGIYEEILQVDGRPNIAFQLDNIGYDQTRFVNAHTDYRTRHLGGPFYELLFSLPGNQLPIYHDLQGDGTVDLSNGAIHHITIEVKDAFDNTSTLHFDLQEDTSSLQSIPSAPCKIPMFYDSRDIFDTTGVHFYLHQGTLYDQICFHYEEIPNPSPLDYSELFHLNSAAIPLQQPYTLFIQPNRAIPYHLRDKMVIVREGLGVKEVQPAFWEGNWLKANFWNFGDFTLQTDDTPPFIIPLFKRGKTNFSTSTQMNFRIGDQLSGIGNYEAELDGKWLMFGRYHGAMIYYRFDQHCPKGDHHLVLTVTDRSGNHATFAMNFTR